MRRYAEKTQVSVARSKGEIEDLLTRYGADSFASGWQGDVAIIAFNLNSRRIKFTLPMPPKKDFYTKKKYHKIVECQPEEMLKNWEQACRQRWRALALAVKAKMEAVECQIATFEDEFMAYTVMPNGKTLSDILIPQIEKAYTTHKMPPLLSFGDE